MAIFLVQYNALVFHSLRCSLIRNLHYCIKCASVWQPVGSLKVTNSNFFSCGTSTRFSVIFSPYGSSWVEWKRIVMAHAQKPDSVFQRNGRVHLYRQGCQFSRVLAFLECGSGENDCSNTEWTVSSETEDCLATHSIRLFPLHFSSRASPCATRFRFHSTIIGHTSSSQRHLPDNMQHSQQTDIHSNPKSQQPSGRRPKP